MLSVHRALQYAPIEGRVQQSLLDPGKEARKLHGTWVVCDSWHAHMHI